MARPRLLWRWLPVVVYAAAIFVASSIPGRSMPGGRLFAYDKLVHAVVFAGLGALAWRASRSFGLAVAIAAAYGALDELHQRFTPGRSSESLDLVADVVGAALGAAAALALHHALGSRHAHRP